MIDTEVDIPFLPWRERRAKIGLAFSEGFILALRTGRESVTSRRELPQGGLRPSAKSPNLDSIADVARMASEMLDELSSRGGPVALVLPDLAATTMVFPPPAPRGRRLRRELAARLPFPRDEARMDLWRGSKGEALGAAIRETVVRQYEEVVGATEHRVGWVDVASLARVPSWARASRAADELDVWAQIYRSHYCLTVFRGGELLDVRVKLRSPGDVEGVVDELRRLPAVYSVPRLHSLLLLGDSATICAERLVGEAELGEVRTVDESEERALAAALENVLRRG